MSKVLVSEENLTNIANAIREKNGETTTYKPGDMAVAIQNISSGGNVPEKGIMINEWDSDGFPTDISIVGMTKIPDGFLSETFYINNSSQQGCLFYRVRGNIHLSDTITSIGKNAFATCTTLALTELPSGITSIDFGAFQECKNLALTALPSGITSLLGYTFNQCSKLALTELPSGITSLGNYAFGQCSNLALTELPSGITSLGESTFYECTRLALKELPSGITSLPKNVFENCTKLTELTIKGDLTSIEGYSWGGSFSGCTNLNKIILPNVTNVPVMKSGGEAFKNTLIAKGTGYIYVPDTLVDSFKSATNWSNYANQIKPISELEANA